MKALVLDFGGVVTRTLFETHHLTEETLGLPLGTLTWQGPFSKDGDPLWQAMQRGDISERDYWMTRTKEVSALVGQNWQNMQDFVKAARGKNPMAAIRPEALLAITLAKANGVTIAVLSNELDLFYGADFKNHLPFWHNFSYVVDASYTHILKPDPRAYALVCEELGLKPENCVFVDDQMKNVQGAIDFGMSFVHFDVKEPLKSYNEALKLCGVEDVIS